MLNRRRMLQAGLAALGAFPYAACRAAGQAYPARPVRMIVGLPPGSAPEVVARLVARSLTEQMGQTFLIENRLGAATNLAAEKVVGADADGYTLLVATATNAVNASLYHDLKFNFVRDIAPVGSIAAISFILVVDPSFPAKTIPELIANAKANPGKVILASTGVGGVPHVAGEMFMMMAGVDMLHVPYGGSDVAAITELMAGRAQVYFGPMFSVIEQVRAGTLRAIAVTTAARVGALPGIPAIAEFLPGYDVTGWVGIGAPASHAGGYYPQAERRDQRGACRSGPPATPCRLGGTASRGVIGRFRQAHRCRNGEVGQGYQVCEYRAAMKRLTEAFHRK